LADRTETAYFQGGFAQISQYTMDYKDYHIIVSMKEGFFDFPPNIIEQPEGTELPEGKQLFER
jgi:hypothetical protein